MNEGYFCFLLHIFSILDRAFQWQGVQCIYYFQGQLKCKFSDNYYLLLIYCQSFCKVLKKMDFTTRNSMTKTSFFIFFSGLLQKHVYQIKFLHIFIHPLMSNACSSTLLTFYGEFTQFWYFTIYFWRPCINCLSHLAQNMNMTVEIFPHHFK